jgi:hypothetical protein
MSETASSCAFVLAFFRVFGGRIFGCGGAGLGNPWFNLTE